MKHVLYASLALLVVLVPLVARAEFSPQGVAKCRCANANASLSCAGNDAIENGNVAQCTCDSAGYEPSLRLFGKWKYASNVKYYIASSDDNMRLLDTNNNPLPFADVRAAIVTAANQWSDVACCTDMTDNKSFLKLTSATSPSEALVIPADDPLYNFFDSNGNYTGASQGYPIYNRIWVQKSWGENGDTFQDETILATTPAYQRNGVMARARMVINSVVNPPGGHKIRWRLAAAGAANTFHFPTVLTHEFGHFVGYQHSSCSASIMVTIATPSTVKSQLHPQADKGSVCSATQGYGSNCPNTPIPTDQNGSPVGGGSGGGGSNNAAKVGRYGPCNVDADCQSYLKCFEQASEGGGLCNVECLSNVVCPYGEICNGGSENYCRIGQASEGSSGGGSSPTIDPVIPADYCAPCTKHDDCLTGVCVDLGNGQNICSAYCTINEECGENGTCSASDADGGEGICVPIDTSCIQAQSTARGLLNEACDDENPCSADLLCVQLPNTPVCLEACRTDGTQDCSTSGYFCSEVDAETTLGVCFKQTAQEGESCLLPDTSLCGTGGKLLCAGTAAANFQDAKCYKLCGGTYGNTCTGSQSCALYENSTIGVCSPLSTPECLAGLGVKCDTNDDCEAGLCALRGTEHACSRNCTVSTQAGCPASFSCVQSTAGSDTGVCWPTGAVLQSDPKCACTGAACANQGCGGCNSQAPGYESIVLLLLALIPSLKRRLGARQ